MNQIGLFFIFLFFFFFFFFFHAKAQDSPNPHHSNSLHPSLAVVIGILLVMLSLTFLILAFAKFCSTELRDQLTHEQNPNGLFQSRSRFSGIDRTVIESLPFFRFSSVKGSKEGLECVVCLSKFEDTETLRLLPKCRHAFHINCIDQWLENHSSCPLCRYKIDVGDLTNFMYTNSLRYTPSSSNLTADHPSLELFIRREQDHHRSSRFNMENSFQKISKDKEEEHLISEGNRQLMHKFKHKIIVSQIFYKSRWSDVKSSDLMSLNSEIINVISNKRFSPLNSNSGNLQNVFTRNEQIMKIKDDIERKRAYESKVNKVARSKSLSASRIPPNTFDIEENRSTNSRSLNPDEKRTMSEITNLSRFRQFNIRSRVKESLFSGNDERRKRLWLTIARRTVQWFAGGETTSQESERERHPSNV